MARASAPTASGAATGWTTIEEPLELAARDRAAGEDAVLVDCLTLWLSNLMARRAATSGRRPAQLVRGAARARAPVVFVSNEVGLGIVPDNALARAFRDQAGRAQPGHRRRGRPRLSSSPPACP